MEINRNQYFMIGMVILLLGVQFKSVDTFVFNEAASKFIAERLQKPPAGQLGAVTLPAASISPNFRQTWRPPKWIGWALLSVGAVLVLHSLAMKRPE